jgi:hypothetical protein
MNKIYPDGRKVWVSNEFPNFFDISFVFIGAEKCAKTLLKIASVSCPVELQPLSPVSYLEARRNGMLEKSASADPRSTFESALEQLFIKDALAKKAKIKGAEIIKDVVPSQFAAQAVPLLTDREPDLPKALVRIMSRMSIDDVLGTTASTGMVLKPGEFQRLLLTKFGLEDEADRLEQSKTVFPDTIEEEQMDVKPQCFDPMLAKLLLPLLSDRSSFGPTIERRVTIIIAGSKPESFATASPPSELLRKIGSAYKGYRRSLLEVIPQMEPVVRDRKSVV